ncbi:hypothetical protein GIB67_001534 [Kingdonia uniflora]|uniref:HTH La-type RNA-binding domain-containing protein n=1 Tax=Kingdonia uniflora TaxID=39325 RepID=A0A7J7LZC4_9MAGN|nr:hypothetical protein GIB67_001534 [Kingdonia uniflora]
MSKQVKSVNPWEKPSNPSSSGNINNNESSLPLQPVLGIYSWPSLSSAAKVQSEEEGFSDKTMITSENPCLVPVNVETSTESKTDTSESGVGVVSADPQLKLTTNPTMSSNSNGYSSSPMVSDMFLRSDIVAPLSNQSRLSGSSNSSHHRQIERNVFNPRGGSNGNGIQNHSYPFRPYYPRGFNGQNHNYSYRPYYPRGSSGQNHNYPNRPYYPHGSNGQNFGTQLNNFRGVDWQNPVNDFRYNHNSPNRPYHLPYSHPNSHLITNSLPYVNAPRPHPPHFPDSTSMPPFSYYGCRLPETSSSYHAPLPMTVRGPNVSPPPPCNYFGEDNLSNAILKQIEFYFSDANLEKDTYLKLHMDENGWVSIDLIAGFPRMKSITSDTHLILEAMRRSKVVEVQGEQMRKGGSWMMWAQPCTSPLSTTSSCLSQENLLAGINNIHLSMRSGEETTSLRSDVVEVRISVTGC